MHSENEIPRIIMNAIALGDTYNILGNTRGICMYLSSLYNVVKFTS